MVSPKPRTPDLWGRRIPLACGHMRRPQGKQISSNENREAKSITCKAEAPRLLCVKFKKRSQPWFYLFGAQVLGAFFKNATPSLAEHRVTIFSSNKHPQISSARNFPPFRKPKMIPKGSLEGRKPENGTREGSPEGPKWVSWSSRSTLGDPPGPTRGSRTRPGPPEGRSTRPGRGQTEVRAVMWARLTAPAPRPLAP